MTERKTKINSIKPSQRAYDALLVAVHAQKLKGHAATYAEIIDTWLDAATNSVPISEQKLPNVKNGIESVQTSKDAAITPTLRPYVDLLILIAGRGGAEWEATKGVWNRFLARSRVEVTSEAKLRRFPVERDIQNRARALVRLRETIVLLTEIYDERRQALIDDLVGDASKKKAQWNCPDCPKRR